MTNSFSINDYSDNSAYQIFRGLNKAHIKYEWQETDDTSIMNLASKKAEKSENKSEITVALEDFMELAPRFNGYNSTNITAQNVEDNLGDRIAKFFGIKNDNIFKSEEGKDLVSEKGHVFQNDIFDSDIAKNGGVRYAKEGDDLYESALNFAKADIQAIEIAYEMCHRNPETNGKLDGAEISSYTEFDGILYDAIQELNLNKDKDTLSAQEYASYLVAVDELGNSDGVISSDEVEKVVNMKNSSLAQKAQEIYDRYYK